jgi:hypothetical protein
MRQAVQVTARKDPHRPRGDRCYQGIITFVGSEARAIRRTAHCLRANVARGSGADISHLAHLRCPLIMAA